MYACYPSVCLFPPFRLPLSYSLSVCLHILVSPPSLYTSTHTCQTLSDNFGLIVLCTLLEKLFCIPQVSYKESWISSSISYQVCQRLFFFFKTITYTATIKNEMLCIDPDGFVLGFHPRWLHTQIQPTEKRLRIQPPRQCHLLITNAFCRHSNT